MALIIVSSIQFFLFETLRKISLLSIGLLRSVHTVVHEAILPRTFVRVRASQPCTRTKVRVRVRVRRPPTMLDFFVRRTRVRRTNVRACFIQMNILSSLAFQIKWCFYKIYTINCFICYF